MIWYCTQTWFLLYSSYKNNNICPCYSQVFWPRVLNQIGLDKPEVSHFLGNLKCNLVEIIWNLRDTCAFTLYSLTIVYTETTCTQNSSLDLEKICMHLILFFFCLISYKIVANYLSTLNTVKKVEKVLHVNESVTLDFTVAICVLISM